MKLALSLFVALLGSVGAGCVEVKVRQSPDGSVRCVIDEECPGEQPVCDLDAKVCVQCLLPDRIEACGETTPVCGEARVCQGCVAHAECASNVCLPNGACALSSDVAYVLPFAPGATCSQQGPCSTVGIALATARPYVKVAGAIVEAGGLLVGSKPLQIFGEPGTSLKASGAYLFRMLGASRVELHGLRMFGATGSAIEIASGTLAISGCVIDGNTKLGIEATGGTVNVERSVISNNAGGGVLVSGGARVMLSRNFILYNGKASALNGSDVGGIALTGTSISSRIEWNTIAYNQSDGTYRGGVTCTVPLGMSTGNAIFHNSELVGQNVATTVATQTSTTGSTCISRNDKIVAIDFANLGFKAVTAPFDFHLTAGSPLIDAAGTGCLGEGPDIDGQARPAGGLCDYGADEYLPSGL